MQIIIPPHKIPARNCTTGDFVRILKEAEEMQAMMMSGQVFFPKSKNTGCLALAHPQVCNNDPLNFFAVNFIMKPLIDEFGRDIVKDKIINSGIIINPKILSKDKSSRKMSREGCLSFPYRDAILVKRFTKILVDYTILEGFDEKSNKWKLYHVEGRELNDIAAVVFQHEMQHMHGQNIFNNN